MMSCTKVRDASPHVRSCRPAQFSTWLPAMGRSTSVMVPVVNGNTNQVLAALPHRATAHHHYHAQMAIHRTRPVDGEAILAALGLFVGYVGLVVLLIATSSRPKPVHHVDDSASGRPLSTNSTPSAITPTAPVAPSIPSEAVKPIASPDLEAIAQPVTKAVTPLAANAAQKSSAAPRREKALDLLRKARECQADSVVYRQTLAELVRSYGDTPAGAEALNLLAAVEPANGISPTTANTVDETPEVKQSEEKSAPRPQYGLGFMN